MHSRLPLIAGVPGRISVAALTAALLATGCAPSFHSSVPSDAEQLSAAQALPTAAKNTVESTMYDAAHVVINRVIEEHPAPEELSAAGEPDQPEDTDQSETTEAPEDDEHDDAQSEDEQNPGNQSAQSSSRQQRLADWSASLTRAHESAQEDQHPETPQEAEEEPQTEDEPHPTEEDRVPDAETDEQQDETTESDGQSLLDDEPEPPAEPDTATFTGDFDAYLAELASSHPGRISISLQEIGGQGRSGSTGGSDSFVTASTYKVLVAYSIIREVEAENRSWSDMVLGGRDLAQCFHDMIALSDNPCPEQIGPEIGWAQIYSDAAAAGATNTGGGEGGIRTSAGDLTRFMTNLATGSMSMSSSGHETLRNALAENVHRQGIPAGSAGQVLNKPGFISGNLHDTAIVHHPSGTYVLTILSQGSSWESLASITHSIESALYG